MKKGFTLVELLVTIAIMAVLMVLVTPAILSLANKNKANMFCGKVKTAIKAAQLYGEEYFQYIDDTVGGDDSSLMDDNEICNIGGKVIDHCQLTTISTLADREFLKLEKVGKNAYEAEFLDPRTYSSMLDYKVAVYVVNKRINAQIVYKNQDDGNFCADSIKVGNGSYKSFYYQNGDSILIG